MTALFDFTLSLPAALAVFAGAALVVLAAGTRLTVLADELADRSGLGEALMGAIFLGAVTSIPGITASVKAALDEIPRLALANAYGGIAVQTLFLAIADLTYHKANLEHAAASLQNMLMGTSLIVLLGLIAFAGAGPAWTFGGIHPVTPILFLAYAFFMHQVNAVKKEPLWAPKRTAETREDREDPKNRRKTGPLRNRWLQLLFFALLTMIAGAMLTEAAETISRETGIDESVIGAFMLAVVTSLPELVTSVVAVRQGALTLAVGGILGGNAFDTLFVAAADVAYRPGSIYHAATTREDLLLFMPLVMAGILLMGLLRRERKGPGGIGFESLLVILIYLTGAAVLTFAR